MGQIVKTNSQHYTDIAEAIRTKRGTPSMSYYPSEMARYVDLIPAPDPHYLDKIRNIYNHGDVVGMNELFRYNTTRAEYWVGQTSASNAAMALDFATANPPYILRRHEREYHTLKPDTASAGAAAFCFPFSGDDFLTINFDCSVEPTSYQGHVDSPECYLGGIYWSQISKSYTTISCPQINQLSFDSGNIGVGGGRQIVTVNLPSSVYFSPATFNINCRLIIYSVWLE